MDQHQLIAINGMGFEMQFQKLLQFLQMQEKLRTTGFFIMFFVV